LEQPNSLYTGITSQSFVKIKEEKEERKKELSKIRKELLPAGELLSTEIEKEIDRISRVEHVDLSKLTNAFEVKAELLAQARTILILRSVQQRLNNLLRDNKDE
jgi:hypothetical protein